jgi:DNA-binding LacI/PurR family transcriptional regulator
MSDTPIKTTQSQTESICEILRKKIQSGELSNDGKIPAVRKLVELFGYPRNTVWRALLQLKEERYVTTTPTGRYLVHPRFRMNNVGYKALKLAFVGHGNMALANPFLQRVYSALETNSDGFNIEIDLLLGNEKDKRKPADLAKYKAVVLAASWSYPFFEALKKKGKLVTALAAPLNYHLPCDVRIDNFHGGEVAGEAFRATKIKKAVLLGESQYAPDQWHEDFELRVLGFRRAWLQYGRVSQEIQERPLPEDLLPRMREIEKIVAAHDQFTGYFALSDSTALMLLSALRDHCVRVPKEALVIGFDDSPEAAEAEPPLASLCPDPETMAEQLVLHLRTLEAEPGYSNIAYVKPRLIERASLGQYATTDRTTHNH